MKSESDEVRVDMNEDSEQALEIKRIDILVSVLKSVAGFAPCAGSLLAELANIIPGQRIDRIVNYLKHLEQRISGMEQNEIKSRLHDEHFSDLFEEGLRQAGQSVSDERKEYIASFVANSLSSEELKYEESRYLLRILGEINDVEIIWLWYLVRRTNADGKEFRDRHPEILKPVDPDAYSPQARKDKMTLQKSYKEHLARLGLLEAENNDYRTSSLGNLLLRQIGLTLKRQKA